MTQIAFYHARYQKIDMLLVALLEKILTSGGRAVLRMQSREYRDHLDHFLWVCRDEAFLPHGKSEDRWPEQQLIYLTTEDDNPAQANMLFLLEGSALLPEDEQYERIIVPFTGEDDNHLDKMRVLWTQCRDLGFDRLYWMQDMQGKWEQKQ